MLREALSPVEVEIKDRGPAPKMCEPEPFWLASSTLLSRLAEAVDGNRKGVPVVYVAEKYYSPSNKGHEVHGPFETCEDAFKAREDLKNPEKYGIFGPFWTRTDPPNSISSDAKGPRVERVVVHLDNQQMIELKPSDADAIFWSRAAVEKFVIPYYVGIGSLKEGSKILASKGVVLVHRPGSEWRSETSHILVDGKPLEKDPGIGSVVICANPDKDPAKEKMTAEPLV